MALMLTVAACGGQLGDSEPDATAGTGGGGGLLQDAPSSGGFAGDEPWDAMVDGAPATREQLCGMDGAPVSSPCSQDEMSSRLSRRWWQCSGEFVFATPDAVGLEFTANGQWFLLTMDASGAVVRGSGASYQGTWDTYDMSRVNGPCSIQLNIKQTGTVFAFPTFAKHPTRVNLNTGGDGGKPIYVGIP